VQLRDINGDGHFDLLVFFSQASVKLSPRAKKARMTWLVEKQSGVHRRRLDHDCAVALPRYALASQKALSFFFRKCVEQP